MGLARNQRYFAAFVITLAEAVWGQVCSQSPQPTTWPRLAALLKTPLYYGYS